MASATENERATQKATQNRATGEGSKKRRYVLLVPGSRGGFEGVIVEPPDEITFGEESAITPSQEFRSREVRQQAESVLSKTAKGQHFKDDYLNKLQQQLRKSGDSNSKDLAGAVGQLRASQRAKDEARLTAPANRRLDVPTKGVQQSPQPDSPTGIPFRAPEPEKPPEEEFPGANLNAIFAGIGLVRRQAEARGLTNRFAKGEQISAKEARRVAGRLSEAERQGGMHGLEQWQSGQTIQLGEIQFSHLQKAIEDIEVSETKGARAGRKQLTYLGQSALGMERQYQLVGAAAMAGGRDLAFQLADIARTHLENDIKDVFDKAKGKELSGPAYILYLQLNLAAAQRQDELLGKGSPDRTRELALSLGTLPRLALSHEARQVIGGLAKGQNLDDDYVEFLRRRLVEESERRGSPQTRELAEELRDMQASRLESEVLKTLDDAKSGKRFPELYLNYLQQRIGETDAEDKDPERNSGGRNSRARWMISFAESLHPQRA